MHSCHMGLIRLRVQLQQMFPSSCSSSLITAFYCHPLLPHAALTMTILPLAVALWCCLLLSAIAKLQCHYQLSVSIQLPSDHCLQCPLCMLLLPSMHPVSPSVIPVLALTVCVPGYTTGHVPTHIPNTVHCRRCTEYLSQATEPETLIVS